MRSFRRVGGEDWRLKPLQRCSTEPSVRPPNPASARVLEKIGMRLAESYRDPDEGSAAQAALC